MTPGPTALLYKVCLKRCMLGGAVGTISQLATVGANCQLSTINIIQVMSFRM